MGTFVMQNSQSNVGWISAVFAGLMLAGIAHPAIAAEKNEKAKTPAVQIRTDPGIEIVSIIFHLAGNPEYNRICMDSYAQDIEEHFGKFRDHEAVELARQLRQSHGVSYDAPMSLAVHLKGGVKLQERLCGVDQGQRTDSDQGKSNQEHDVTRHHRGRHACDSERHSR